VAEELQVLAQQILEIGPLVMRTVSAELRQHDLVQATAHFRLLWYLKHHSTTLSQLAEHHMVSLPTASNSITILEERGWVTRTRSLEDRRRVMIEITPAGLEVLAQVHAHMEAKVAEIIAPLSEVERASVLQGLAILKDAFINAKDANEWCAHQQKK
jgi:DNA-binding MarR family transcriptional regulator